MTDHEATPKNDTLTPMEYGIAGGSFEIVASNHGDGDSFSWKSKASEADPWHGYSYKVSRVERGYAVDDGTPASSWRLEVRSQGGETKTFLIDCPRHQIWEEQERELKQATDLDEAWNAVLDLVDETRRLNRPLQNLIRPIGHTGEIALIPIRQRPGPSDEAS